MLEVVTRTQEGILVADIEKSQEYTLEFDDPDRVDIRSIICVPLIARNQTIGALSISNSTQASAWDPQCLHLMMILAGEAAIAVDNALMYQRVNDAYVEIIGNLVGSIEPKDMAAVEHSSRTMHIASELAQRMGLDQVDINAVRYVVLIHNLGKVGLDTKLATRTDVFLNEVRKSLRSIAVSDQTALASLHFLERVNPIIKYQHEWYNGCGIPEGKKENAIPLGSRIVSVVDSFHRLVYPSGPDTGAPLSVPQAIEQIQCLAGTQFDPAVVTTFVKIINEAATEPLRTSPPEVK
jgi:response regulator RpfG family c-di-GMP phosphodiesterase